jgi:hypothetical protein
MWQFTNAGMESGYIFKSRMSPKFLGGCHLVCIKLISAGRKGTNNRDHALYPAKHKTLSVCWVAYSECNALLLGHGQSLSILSVYAVVTSEYWQILALSTPANYIGHHILVYINFSIPKRCTQDKYMKSMQLMPPTQSLISDFYVMCQFFPASFG